MVGTKHMKFSHSKNSTTYLNMQDRW